MTTLNSDIKTTGVNQNDLVTYLENVKSMCNANKTAINAIITAAGATGAAVADIGNVTPVSVTDLTLLKG